MEELWNRFMKSGKISDYLDYIKSSKDDCQ